MASTIYQDQLTLAGATTINFRSTLNFIAEAVLVSNDDPAAVYTVTIAGRDSTLEGGEVAVYTGSISSVTLNGVGDCRVYAVESADKLPSLTKTISTITPSAGSITAAMLVDDTLTNAHLVAGAGGKFAPGAFDQTAVTNLFAANAWAAATVLSAFQALSIPFSRIEDGGALEGMTLTKAREHVNTDTDAAIEGVYSLLQAADAAGNIDIIVDDKVRVLDCHFVQSQVGNVADTVQLFNGAAALTDAMAFTVTQFKRITPSTLDTSAAVLNAGGTLRMTLTDGSAGAGDLRGVMYVRVVKVA